MEFLFSKCSSLLYLPDISKWNLNNVKNINGMFSECSSLKGLSDISNWSNYNRNIDCIPEVNEKHKVEDEFLLFFEEDYYKNL